MQYSTHGRGKLRLTGSTLLGRDSESGQWRFDDGGTQVVRSARQSVPSVRLQWELPL